LVECYSNLKMASALGVIGTAGGRLESRVELGNIGRERSGSQVNRCAVGDQQGFRVVFRARQQLAKSEQLGTQPAAALLEARLRPEQLAQDVTGMRMPGMVGEISEQRRRFLALQRDGDRVSPAQL